jgi:shikimate kinase
MPGSCQPEAYGSAMTNGGSGVALVGFMGSGKTTVARLLARHLDWPRVDLDEQLVASHGPIAGQVARDGLLAFRLREREEALRWCSGGPRILATGGGTWLEPEVRAAICAAYRTVWLDAPLVVLSARIGSGEGRPLWDDRVAARHAERLPIYAAAELRIDTSDRTPEAVADHIVSHWRLR